MSRAQRNPARRGRPYVLGHRASAKRYVTEWNGNDRIIIELRTALELNM